MLAGPLIATSLRTEPGWSVRPPAKALLPPTLIGSAVALDHSACIAAVLVPGVHVLTLALGA